jgi:ATP-dependent Clp protease protease subunit
VLRQEDPVGRPTFEARGQVLGEGSPLENLEQLLSPQADNSRMVFLHSDVTENVVANVIAQLLHLANLSRAPIHLVISTYGGSIDEMFSLYDTIKFLPCPIHTVALGKVMSAGVLLLASGVKGKRLIGSSARIMMHPVSGGAQGNVFELENSVKEAKRLQELMATTLVKETKMTRAQIEKVMNPMLDYYVTPKDAVGYGIVDKIIGAI